MSAAEINRAFAAIWNNGRGEVGLEVGVDPGLPESDYIRIPRGMAKSWFASIVDTPANRQAYVANLAALNPTVVATAATSATIPIAAKPATPEECAGLFGWLTGPHIYATGGDTFVQIGASRVLINEFFTRPPTMNDVATFYVANQGHINDVAVGEHRHNWIHAVRFWAVVNGMVTVGKSTEYIIVDDPTVPPGVADEFATFCSNYRPNAATAAAARAGTWRKTNHATGGAKVAGFARRWLQKEGYMSTATDSNTKDQEDRAATSAFYVATHAISCHAALSLLAPSDEGHWALIDPQFGLCKDWSVKASVTLRLAPKTQVAGGAMVADAVEVLKMVIREGLAPLLNHSGQASALKAQYDLLAGHGVACATYAGWFLDGHPDSIPKVDYNQKDAKAADLIGELGHVATKFYKSSTIGASPALASAASQLGDSVSEGAWTRLASEKKNMSQDQIVECYAAIRGGSTIGQIQGMLSTDVANVREAVVQHNLETTTLAAQFGVAHPTIVDDATVIKNRGLEVGNQRGPTA